MSIAILALTAWVLWRCCRRFGVLRTVVSVVPLFLLFTVGVAVAGLVAWKGGAP